MDSPDHNQPFFLQVVSLLAQTLDLDEPGKLAHGRQVAHLSHALAVQINAASPGSVYLAGLFHDIGGMGLKNELLHHPRQGLDDVAIRKHAGRGAAILAGFRPFAALAEWVRDHHERHDGSGFPAAKARQEISAEAGIIHLADLLATGSLDDLNLNTVLVFIDQQSGRAVAPAVAAAGRRLFANDPTNLSLLARPLDEPSSLIDKERIGHLAGLDGLGFQELICQLLWLLAHVADAKHLGRQQNHSIQVAFYSHAIARHLHLPGVDPMDVLWAALLHNLGLTSVLPEELQMDFETRARHSPTYRRHPHIGAGLIRDIPALAHLASLIAAHHEHDDGTGFPLGLKGDQIPAGAQIIAMADAHQWIAGSSTHENRLHERALNFLEKGKGTLFAPDLVDRALPIFDALGRRDNSWLQDLSNVYAFFNTQQLEEALARSEVVTRDEGADSFTLFPRQWQLVRLSDTLELVSGAEEFSVLAGVDHCRHLKAILTGGDHGKLLARLSQLAIDRTMTLSLRCRNRKTLEMIFTRKKNGYDLLARGINTAPIFEQTSSVYYRNFINHPEPELLLDGQSRIREVNTAFLDCLQIPRESLLQSTITGLFEPFLSPSKFAELQLFFKNPEARSWSDEFTFITGRKNHLSIAAAIYRICSQECEQGTCLCRISDISERKRIEQEIRQRDNELQAIVHNTTGMTGESFFRALLDQLMMLTKAEIGMVAELTDDNQRLLPHVLRNGHRFLPSPNPFNLHGSPCRLAARRAEAYFPRRLRELFPADPFLGKQRLDSYWGLPLRKEDGAIIGVLCLYGGRPILHSKNMRAIARIFQARIAGELARLRTERALLEKDRQLERQNSELTRMNQLKSDMIAITSHDLKAPLSAIIGYASLLEEYSSTMDRDKTLHYIRRIQKEGQKQLAFINKLLDLYRIESGAIELSFEPYRLDTLLASCLSSLREVARTREISFTLSINGQARPLLVDHLRIGQVLNNLLANAIKFSPEKGKIAVHYQQNDEHVTIDIKDQGPGINEQEISHIFDRYYMGRTDFKIRPEGSGLGLYIVRNIVELHGGSVSARNLGEGGSCFTVRLPTTTPPACPEKQENMS